MTMWFNVDDRLPNSPEVLAIPRRYRAAALGVWTLCGSYTSGHLTDRFVSDEIVRDCGGTPEIRSWLVKSGLWEEDNGGIVFTGVGCRIPTAHAVRKRRATVARAVRKHRAAVTHEDETAADIEQSADVIGLHHDCMGADYLVPNGVMEDKSSTTPTEPKKQNLANSPTSQAQSLRKSGTETARARGTARGTRLPQGWEPPEAEIRSMHEQFPWVPLRAEHAKFCDYWHGKAGQGATKMDWIATWRNWMRRAAEQTPQRNGHTIEGPDAKALDWMAMGRHPPDRGQPDAVLTDRPKELG